MSYRTCSECLAYSLQACESEAQQVEDRPKKSLSTILHKSKGSIRRVLKLKKVSVALGFVLCFY